MSICLILTSVCLIHCRCLVLKVNAERSYEILDIIKEKLKDHRENIVKIITLASMKAEQCMSGAIQSYQSQKEGVEIILTENAKKIKNEIMLEVKNALSRE